MKPNDVVWWQLVPKKGPPIWCRSIVQEVHGPVARIKAWTGKEFLSSNAMVKELRTTKPE